MPGQGEWGQCECHPLTTSQIKAKDTSDHDDNGLKCHASNGMPCHFPFQWNGKVTLQLKKISYIKFNQYFRFINLAQRITITYPGAAQKVKKNLFSK